MKMKACQEHKGEAVLADLNGGPQWLTQGASTLSAWLETTKAIVETGGTIVTSIAVIIGGCWVYYKFFKERTYYPRIAIAIAGQEHLDRQLHVRVTLKNIGTSRVDLQQKGTALILHHQSTSQRRPLEVDWTERGAFSIFPHHSWIESSEQISYDLVLNVSKAELPVMFAARIVCTEGKTSVDICSNTVVWPGDKLESMKG